MAHGLRAQRLGHMGREYWSRRPGSMGEWGKKSKVYTHRKERVETHRLERAVVALVVRGIDPQEDKRVGVAA